MVRLDGPDAQRFTQFFSERVRHTRRLAYLLCGDWHRAEDLTQTAFVRLAASWQKVREPAALDAYLRTCLTRAFLNEERRVWRKREAVTGELPELSSGGDEGQAVTDRVAVLRALARVAPRQRAVLVCRYYDGLDVAETARVLGCSEGTVKSQSARGLATMRAPIVQEAPELTAAARGDGR